MDNPLCDDVWRQLHEKLTNKPKIQLQEGEEWKAVLDISFEELGHEQQKYFVKLAVLAYDVIASKDMLRYLWGKHVIDALWKGCQTFAFLYQKNMI